MTPDEFKQARRELGLTLSELAHILDTDRRTLQRWEADPNSSTTARAPNPIACQVLRWLKSGKLKL